MKYVIELSEEDFDNIKHAYTAIFGDIYHIMQGAIANGKALEQESCEDCVSRQAVLEVIDDCNSDGLKGIFCSYDDGERFKEYIKNLPPVQPKYNTSEWCHDCSEYNQDKHCCPRFNRVIRNAVKEVKKPKMGHWIDADKLKEKIQKYQSIHDSYCDNISKGDAWEGHTTDHYDLSSGKATACDVILGFINELQAESDE